MYSQISNTSSGRDYGGGAIAGGIILAIVIGCTLLASLLGIISSWLALQTSIGGFARVTLILYLLPLVISVIYYFQYRLDDYLSNRKSEKWYELSHATESGDIKETKRLLHWRRPGSAVLKIAIKNNDIEMMKMIINARVKNIDDVLKTAIKTEQVPVIQLLLDSGANINHLVRGQSILTLATTEEVARALVNAGCDPGVVSEYGETILMMVTEKNHLDVVNYLLSLNVDTQAIDYIGRNALHYANFHEGKIIQSLLDNGVSCKTKDESGLLPLHEVWQFNHNWDQDVPKSIDSNGNSFDPWQGMRSLVKCTGNIDAVDDRGETVLMKAVEKKFHKIIFDFMIEMDANINAVDHKKQTVLFRLSSMTGQSRAESGIEAMHYLLKHSASVNHADIDGNTVLHIMVKEYISEEFITVLLSAGADPNLKNKSGQTGFIDYMHYADRQNNMSIATINSFLEQGADISLTDIQGNTPLMIALDKHYPGSTTKGVFTQLIQSGQGKINNMSNYNGETALMIAFQKSRYDIAHQLIENGVNVLVIDNQGNNMFHHMAKSTGLNASYMEEFIIPLIAKGVSQTLVNKQGKSVNDLLTKNKLFENYNKDILDNLISLLNLSSSEQINLH